MVCKLCFDWIDFNEIFKKCRQCHKTRNRRLDFGGNLDHCLGTGIFKIMFAPLELLGSCKGKHSVTALAF